MRLFADSSALVKLYAEEEGSDTATQMLRAPGAVAVVSALARVEVPAALWKKQRLGELTVEEAGTLVRAFEAHWAGTTGWTELAPVEIEPTLRTASRLTGAHGLRSLDAIQLAGAMAARAAVPECSTLLTFDATLARAATVEGFRAIGAGGID